MLARTSSRSLARSSSVSPTIVITGTMTAMSDGDRPAFAAPSAMFASACRLIYPGSPRGEAGLHGQQVVPQPRTGPFEVHAITPDDVSAHLRTQAEPKIPAGRFLQLPRRRRGHAGA